MNEERPLAEALAVGRDGRIVAVGGDEEIAALASAGTRVENLGGRTLIPGFFDCHMHILWLGQNLGQVDLGEPEVAGTEEILRLLRARLDAEPDLACVQGNRYDQNRLPGSAHITRLDLDRVSDRVPIRVTHVSGHAAVVNTPGLRRLGVTRDTADPPGGVIERDRNGEPTGLLLEAASWANLERILPELKPSQGNEALARASSYLLARGITSASDACTRPADIAVFAQAVSTRALQVRTGCMVGWVDLLEREGEASTPGPNDLQPSSPGVDWHRLHVGQAKVFADGAISTRTSWLTEPFVGMPGNCGLPLHSPDELKSLIRRAHDAGWQLATHAIGDLAIDAVLTAYADAQHRNSRRLPGHRIEHCMLLTDELISRLRRHNVWCVGQPEFISRIGDTYVAALGAERADRLSPYATLERRNVGFAFSSDCPVVPGAPLDGIRAAIDRRAASGRVMNGAERISAESALYAYTAAPAAAARVHRDRGTLEPGKWADLALLSADPVTTPADDWDAVRVDATYVGGACLFRRE